MLRTIAFAMLIFVGGPALAQQTTNCSPDGIGGVHCVTNGSRTRSGVNWQLLQQPPAENPIDAFRRGFEDEERARGAQRQNEILADQQQELAAQQAAQARTANYEAEQRELGVRVGKMVQAGDCPGAISVALSAGNIELANSVKQFCSK